MSTTIEVDLVNQPAHYKSGKFECIDVLEDTMPEEAYLGYLQGNVTKYLWRWRDKGGVQDLQKAQWYLNKLVEKVGGADDRF